MVRPRSHWVGLPVAMVVALAGCAEKRVSEAPKLAVSSLQPCDAAVNAMEALRAMGAAKEPGGQPVLLSAEVLRARNLLWREGLRCYEQRLADILAIESSDRHKAMESYESLKSFVASLRAFEVGIPAIDFDTKIAALREIDVEAGETYAAAEAARQALRCQEAIPLYGRSLNLVANYKDAQQKIAECHYELAAAAMGKLGYREAAHHFRMAAQYHPNYRDSRMRAARLHLALGNHFLAQGYPRNAVVEYEAAESIHPNAPGVRSRLEAARAKALERLAVAGISNRTGNTIEGMAVERIIAEGISEKLLERKSQFLELVTRNQLEAALSGVGLGLKDMIGRTTVPGLEKLRGVRYVITGRLMQVSQKKGSPVRTRRETSVQVPVYQTVTEVDQAGRAQTSQRQVGTRTQRVQFDEIAWSSEFAVAGAVDVFDVQAGKVVVSRSFDKRESGGGRWAENPSLPGAQSQLSAEVQSLVQTTSTDAITRRALESLTDELATAILELIDVAPSVPDPTLVLAELQEPRAAVSVTPAPGGERPARGAAKADVASRPQRVRVRADAINIRFGPSTQTRVLGGARRGDVFPLLSRQKDWVKIRISDGREGWIAERLVEIVAE